MNLLLVATLLLSSAIAIGLYLVYLGVNKRRSAPALGLLHAGLALSGVAVLFTLIFTSTTDKLNNLAALFLLFAVIGGGMVFALREANRPPPMAGVIAHAIMGVIGVSLLAVNLN